MNRKNLSSPLITALYCRLSLEDGRDNESMSISNQKAMLRDYAEKNGFFNYAFYYDYSTDEHRAYLYKTNDENEIVSVDIVNDNDYVAFIIGPYERIRDIRIIKSEKELKRHFRKIGEV